MKDWLKSLWSETLLSVWWILSACSTLSTFFVRQWSGRPRLISEASAILGFAWANFRVYRKQRDELSRLKVALSSQEAIVSRLRIEPDNGSRYILAPVGNVPHGDFRGGYLEFHLMIENTGRRDSTITTYEVEIIALRQTFRDLIPLVSRN